MKSLKFKDLKYRKIFLKNEKKIIYNKFLFIHLLNKQFNKNMASILKFKHSSKLQYKVKTKIVGEWNGFMMVEIKGEFENLKNVIDDPGFGWDGDYEEDWIEDLVEKDINNNK